MAFLAEIRHNTRLRLGLWLILTIVLSYSVLLLSDQETALLAEYQAAATRLQQVEQVIAQPQWPQRAQAMREQLVRLESTLWQANTEGLAQASLQSWLENQARVLQVQSPTVRVDPPIDLPELSAWQVKAQLEGDFEQAKLYDLLLAIAQAPQQLVIERLEASQLSRTPRFQMIVVAYFQAGGVQ